MTAKSISIKDTERRCGGCASKVVELTSGGLTMVAEAEREKRLREEQSDPKTESAVSRGRSR